MKGIKVIEESRFLSKDTMEMVKGGLTCEKGNIYKLCNSGGYILCGAYSYKQCYNRDCRLMFSRERKLGTVV